MHACMHACGRRLDVHQLVPNLRWLVATRAAFNVAPFVIEMTQGLGS